MRIIVFGANGKTGKLVVAQALQQGMEVTAFVRDASSFQPAEHLRVVEGQATQLTDVKAAIVGHDAVINCVGGPGLRPATTVADITANILASMNDAGIKRIVQMSSAGVHNELTGIAGKTVMLVLKNPLADHRLAYERLVASGLDYTLARPMGLTNGEQTDRVREAESGIPTGGREVSRADVAHFLLKALQDDHYIGKSIGLAY
ncbi:MAG: NAD(P)-dependent oxidoreductase [Bacilli bacterium]